jgi:hypothetical protein
VELLLVAIDSFIFAILDRPSAYAQLPESLEDNLSTIEALRNYLLETCFGREIKPVLRNFLMDHNLAGRTLCDIFDEDTSLPLKNASHKYNFIVSVWRDYLASSGRNDQRKEDTDIIGDCLRALGEIDHDN